MTNAILIFLISILLLAISAFLFSRREHRQRIAKGLPPDEPKLYQRPADCCGKHEICEHDLSQRQQSITPVYFDDEELDVYRGTPPNKYTDKDRSVFAEILHTLLPEDVRPWILSLGQRGITLPDEVRKEAHRLCK
ncbi:MAG: hypothetical protein SPI72_02240 [Porphyromonas sp.]|nr:hypothetical protein [Porphyromonas sp.]